MYIWSALEESLYLLPSTGPLSPSCMDWGPIHMQMANL